MSQSAVLRDVLPVPESWTTSRWVKGRVGSLEAPLSFEPWFRDGPTFDLLLHLLPLLTGQHEVDVLSGDVVTEIVLVHREVCRKLWRRRRSRLIHTVAAVGEQPG